MVLEAWPFLVCMNKTPKLYTDSPKLYMNLTVHHEKKSVVKTDIYVYTYILHCKHNENTYIFR